MLDLCAAPGGKSTHLVSLMQNQGCLVANEIHPRRVWELAENLERWGARNAIVTNETPERLGMLLGGFFDKVLVDAPCSGEAMFRKNMTACRDWSLALVESCALRQESILQQAMRLVRPGGTLAYSTCTFNPQENERTIVRFLDQHPGWELLDAAGLPGVDSGRPDWLEAGLQRPDLRRTARIWPHTSIGEGAFLALLRSPNTEPEADHYRFNSTRQKVSASQKSGLLEQARKLFREFCQHNLNGHAVLDIDPARLILAGSYLYFIPEMLPDLSGLKVIHPGWWLGIVKQSHGSQQYRFEPAHALALALNADSARRRLECTPESVEVIRYLQGGSLPANAEEGWTLITTDGFPLGWGKAVHGQVKNYYPRGLRWV